MSYFNLYLGTKKEEYLLKVDNDGEIIKVAYDERFKTAADNSVKTPRTARMVVEQMHGGKYFFCRYYMYQDYKNLIMAK